MRLTKGDVVLLKSGDCCFYDGTAIQKPDGTQAENSDVNFVLRYEENYLAEISKAEDREEDSTADFLPECEYGSRGLTVCLIQTALKCRGYYNDTVDGVFLDKTHAALREFMRDNYLSGDTVADINVYKLLFRED